MPQFIQATGHLVLHFAYANARATISIVFWYLHWHDHRSNAVLTKIIFFCVINCLFEHIPRNENAPICCQHHLYFLFSFFFEYFCKYILVYSYILFLCISISNWVVWMTSGWLKASSRKQFAIVWKGYFCICVNMNLCVCVSVFLYSVSVYFHLQLSCLDDKWLIESIKALPTLPCCRIAASPPSKSSSSSKSL